MIDHGITVENLMRVFPMAFAEDERLQALGKAIAEELVKRSSEARLSVLYANIDSLPENVLDILAYDFKVDWWDTSYTLEEKRRTLKNSWKVHRMMGTKAAVEMAISAIYPNTTVEEWFEYGGKPYHFKLTIDATHERTDIKQHAQILNRINYYKNLRSHLECITYVTRCDEDAVLRLGGAAGTIMVTPLAEEESKLTFEDLARIGGQFGLIENTPIEEQEAHISFRSEEKIGGQFAQLSSTPITEQRSRMEFRDVVRIGGQGASIAQSPLFER